MLWIMSFFQTVVTVLLLVFLSISCGDSSNLQSSSISTTCQNGVALIQVYDGILQNLCGCTEPSGSLSSPSDPLTCTISVGSTVIFQFSDNQEARQILSIGTPTFPSSPMRTPGQADSTFNHPVSFQTTGTYHFQDAYNGTMAGQIIVQ